MSTQSTHKSVKATTVSPVYAAFAMFAVFATFPFDLSAQGTSGSSQRASSGEGFIQATDTMSSMANEIVGFDGFQSLESTDFIGRGAPGDFIGRGSSDSGTSRRSSGSTRGRTTGTASSARATTASRSTASSRQTNRRGTTGRNTMTGRGGLGGFGGAGGNVIQSLVSYSDEGTQDVFSRRTDRTSQRPGETITVRLLRTRFARDLPVVVEVENATAILRGVVRTEREKRLLRQYVLLEPGIAQVKSELVSAEDLRPQRGAEEAEEIESDDSPQDAQQ